MKLKLYFKTLVLFLVSSIGKSNLVSFISKYIFILLFSLTVSASISSSLFSSSSFFSSFSLFSCSFDEVEIILSKSFPKTFRSFANVSANLSPNIFFLFSSFLKYCDIVIDSLLVKSSAEISDISLILLNCFLNNKLPLTDFASPDLSFNISFL